MVGLKTKKINKHDDSPNKTINDNANVKYKNIIDLFILKK